MMKRYDQYHSTHVAQENSEDDGMLVLNPPCPHCKTECHTDRFDPEAEGPWPLVMEMTCWSCGGSWAIEISKPVKTHD